MFFAIPTLLLQTRTRHDLKFDGTLLNLDLILKQNILNESQVLIWVLRDCMMSCVRHRLDHFCSFSI